MSATFKRWEKSRIYAVEHSLSKIGMDELQGKTPQMVCKELYVYEVAYNLLRTLMWEAGRAYGVDPLRLSVQRTRQHLNNFILELASTSTRKRDRLYQTLLLSYYSQACTEAHRSH